MTREDFDRPNGKAGTVAEWQTMLKNSAALLAHPGRQHRALIKQAHSLHQAQTINSDDLSDLLELADGALAFAVESLLDIAHDE